MNTEVNTTETFEDEFGVWERTEELPPNIVRDLEKRANGELSVWDFEEPTVVEKIQMFIAEALNEIRWFFIKLKNRY